MNRFEDVLGRLNGDEKKAIRVLLENGWLAFVDVGVEKAVTEESKYQTFSVGGYYDIGFMKKHQVLPLAPARKTKKPKKG